MEEDEGREKMQLDYFYGSSSEHFRFYQIPALLLEEECYRKLRDTAKLLYGVLLSQLSLSRKNGWIEPETGRVYIHYNLRYLAECLGHSTNTITRAMQDLCEAGLLRRRRRGRGLPDILYVMDFTTTARNTGEKTHKTEVDKADDVQEGINVRAGKQESANNNSSFVAMKDVEIDNTEISDRELSYKGKSQELNGEKRPDGDEEVSVTEIYQSILKEQINYSYLLKNNPLDAELIEEILSVMVDSFTTRRKYLRVNGGDRSVNEVQNRLKRIDASHIEYILRCMKESTKKIVNPPLFLLTALYNAPATINTYYNALAAHDMSHGFFADHSDGESPSAGNSRQEGEKDILGQGKTVGEIEKERKNMGQEDANRDADYDALEVFLLHREMQGDSDKGG